MDESQKGLHTLRRRDFVAALLATVPVMALDGCSLLEPRWRYRYRLTVEVVTPEGLKTGSSVIEVERRKTFDGSITAKVHGEAAVVDLGRGGLLFALLKGGKDGSAWPYSFIHHTLAGRLGTQDMVSDRALDRLVSLQGASAVLEPVDYPILVRFANLHDPKSVEAVDPDNLSSYLGPAVRLNRITVQVTDDSVTTGIERYLEVIGIKPDHGLDEEFRVTTNPTLAQKLSFRDFVKRV